jgi:hypothetical protein
MLQTVALTTVAEASVSGHSSATFHGYRIIARRVPAFAPRAQRPAIIVTVSQQNELVIEQEGLLLWLA